MFRDLKDFSSKKILNYDICIVGTGPAGLSVAKKLLGTELRVAILESGGLEPESRYQELNEGKNSGPRFLSLDGARLRCFGGAGKLWAGHCAPFEDDEFKAKSFIHLSGWPISSNDLNLYYKQAASMLGISYEKFFNEDYLGKTLSEKSFKEFKRKNSFLTSTVKQISSSKNRDFSEKYKSDFEASTNTDIIFHSTVTEINLFNDGKDVESVTIANLDGNNATVKSKIFVLACGALENPRILLSSNKYYKEGIGNSYGFVGSYFMSHPGVQNVARIYKTDNKTCISDSKQLSTHKVFFEVSSNERSKSNILRHSLSIKVNDNITREMIDFFKNKSNCEVEDLQEIPLVWDLDVGLEQPPRKKNKLKLDTNKDALGMRKINMFWDNLSDIEKDTVVKSVKTMARELGVLGTGKIRFKKELLNGESYKFEDSINHHIGTTRMSDSPKTGVVDKNCKVFGLSNLYIASSSVFATSSVVNPTYTIIALSLRLGDHIKNIKL